MKTLNNETMTKHKQRGIKNETNHNHNSHAHW